MEDNRIYIDDLFLDKLQGYTEMPDAAVWDKLEQRLDANPPKKRYPLIWLWCALLIATLLLCFLAAKSVFPNIYTHHQLNNIFNTLNHTDKKESKTTTTTHTGYKPARKKSVTHSLNQPHATGNDIIPTSTLPEKTITKISTTTAPVNKPEINIPAPKAKVTTVNKPVANIPAPEAKQTTTSLKQVTVVDSSNTNRLPTAPVLTKQHIAAMKMVQRKKEISTGKTAVAPALQAPYITAAMPTVQLPAYEELRDADNGTNAQQSLTPITVPYKTTKAKIAANKKAAYVAALNAMPPPAAAQPVSTLQQQDLQPMAIASLKEINNPFVFNTPSTPNVTPPPIDYNKGKITWEYGAKTGYEMGFNKYSANKGVLGAFIQANVTKRWSVVVQPTVKYAGLKQTAQDASSSYYHVTKNDITALHIITPNGADTNGNPIFNVIRRYFYAQTYDSIVVAKSIKPKNYVELEIPLIVQYKVLKNTNVYGGISANFSKLVSVERQVYEYKNITKYDTLVFAQVDEGTPAPQIPAIESRFKYSASPYSEYEKSGMLNADKNPVRFNYLFGINYCLKNGLSFDVMLQGMLGNGFYIPDDRIRSIYQQPYVRIGIGYRVSRK